MYEDGYTHGTDALAGALASSNAKALVGGGDTIAAVSKFNFPKDKVFISSGGGAMLEFLANGILPALKALN
jgi:phosphoglycerate kinase